MEDYGDELLNDLSSSSESESESPVERVPNDSVLVLGFQSKVLPQVSRLRQQLRFYANEEEMDYLELVSDDGSSEEHGFIVEIHRVSSEIGEEIVALDAIIKSQYKWVFPELETLIKNCVDYARVVLLVGEDLSGVKALEGQLQAILPTEKVLLVMMAAIQQQKKNGINNSSNGSNNGSINEWKDVSHLCESLLQLETLNQELNGFLAAKLLKFAPNVTALIGPITTSQLLLATGSLKQLAQTPSCNVPSLGMKEMSTVSGSVSNNVTHNTKRNTGYLYHTPIVQFLPNDVVKQAMRILSGKIVLAARIDASKSSPGGDIGRQYLAEVEAKLDKLLTPPENVADKALPIPVDKKSKKRGGKRFRKMKERMGMSELRKAQNKMAFAKQEDTVIDGFGEEIGLGMSKGVRQISANTGAVMSKGLAARLRKLEETGKSANDLDLVFYETTKVGSQKEKEGQEQQEQNPRKRQKIASSGTGNGTGNGNGNGDGNKWFKQMSNTPK